VLIEWKDLLFNDPRLFKNNPPVELHGRTAVSPIESQSIPHCDLCPFAKATTGYLPFFRDFIHPRYLTTPEDKYP